MEVNAARPTQFENEVFAGEALFLHRPDPEPGSWPYAEHFEATSRRWEMRCQGVFKADPGEVFFGAELADDVKLSRKSHYALKWLAKVVGQLAAIRGVTCHYSFDMVNLEDGSEVRPHFVAPILSAQAIVVTPKGKTPPSLTQSFPETPLPEKLQLNINTDDTFTFCFWFKSLDFARWELCNLPFHYESSLEPFVGKHPIHLIAYSIRRPECEGDVHAECNKNCMVRIVCSPPEDTPVRTSSFRKLTRQLSRSLSIEKLLDRPAVMPSVRLFMGADDKVGVPVNVNSNVGIPFETDLFVGHVIFLQRPTPEPFHDDWPYSEHFRPSQRRWEMRCQGKFKKLPGGEVYFGAEMARDTTLTWSKRQVANWVLKIAKMLAAAKGVWFDHSFFLVKQDDGSVVLPHYVSPMCAAEALYVTPPGEEPPLLTASIAQNPLAEKQRVECNLEDTFTIALWNKQLDFARWQICNMPLGWTSTMTPFVGEQPIHLVAYGLKKKDVDGDPHADTNKDYILRLEVSPPPMISDWSCHQGLQTGVIAGRAAAHLHTTAERVAPRTLASAMDLGDGQDLRQRSRFVSCLPNCCAWCQ